MDTIGAVSQRSSRRMGADLEGNQHLFCHYLSKVGDITRSRTLCFSQVSGKDLEVREPVFGIAISENTLRLRFLGQSLQYVPNIRRFGNRFYFEDLKV